VLRIFFRRLDSYHEEREVAFWFRNHLDQVSSRSKIEVHLDWHRKLREAKLMEKQIAAERDQSAKKELARERELSQAKERGRGRGLVG
jgi:hypothetical protein